MDGKLISNILSELPIKRAYEDGLSPAVKKIGQTLDKIITATGFNIASILEKGSTVFSSNLIYYLEKFNKVPADKIVQPPTEIAYNVLSRFKYIECSELREMFSNLLFSASHKDFIDKAHPSFIKIIDSLAVDEARILKYLYKTNRTYIIFASYNNLKTAMPGILYKNGRAVTCVEVYEDLLFPNMIDFYLDNLIQLGLLHSSVNLNVITKNIDYHKKDIPILKNKLREKNVKHDGLPDIIIGGFGRTEPYEFFKEACIVDKDSFNKL